MCLQLSDEPPGKPVSKKTKEKKMSCSVMVKYRTYELGPKQQAGGPAFYDESEQIHGPFEFVSKEMCDGYPVVHCHGEGGAPGITFGPIRSDENVQAGSSAIAPPRPTLWVMNYYGATIAKYDL